MSRSDLLGSALLCYIGAGLFTLYLLFNPGAAVLEERFGTTSVWGTVLAMVSLGIAVPGRRLIVWALPCSVLPLILLPPPWACQVGPVALAAGIVPAALSLRRRTPKGNPRQLPKAFSRRAAPAGGPTGRRWKRPPRQPATPAPISRRRRGRLYKDLLERR